MILDKTVIIRWCGFNKKYYENLGYRYTKIGDSFEIDIKDLQKSSNFKILCECDNCKEKKEISFYSYNSCTKNNTEKYYCFKCGHLKTIDNNIKNYGVKYFIQSKDIQEKIKKTNIEKYGFEYSLKNKTIRNKIKETCLKKYGFENPFQNEDIKEKIKKTNITKYGVEYANQSEQTKEKIKKTCLDRYGVENPSLNLNIVEKMIQSQIDKYGELFFKYIPRYNSNSIFLFDLLSEKLNIPILHALNGGEKKFQRYWVDGFISEYNIVLEWDEPKHNYTKQKEKDLKRQKYIEDNFGCKFIRINQKEYFKNEEETLKYIITEIKRLI